MITHPVEEDFTEFYILGLDGKAEGYPSELDVGEEGEVILGISNRENQPMSYLAKMTVAGIPEKEIGPLELKDDETWEEVVGFTPSEPCARTVLAEAINSFYGPELPGTRYITVESTEQLQPGDFVWVGNSQRRIEGIEDSKLILNKPITRLQVKGTPVTEIQKVEFKLYKIRELDEDDGSHTQLAMWLGRENLDATIINKGQDEAEYHIEVKVRARLEEDDKEIEKTGLYSTELVALKHGEEWLADFSYVYPGAVWQNSEMSLYNNDDLTFKEDTLGGYPALHLWIEVQKDVR